MYHYAFVLLLLFVSLFAGALHAQVWQSASDCPDGLATDSRSARSKNTYDFLVVGVGQAGSVAAARLVENGKYTVLGIEGGERSHRSLGGTDYVTSSFSQGPNGTILLNTPFTRFDVPLFFPSTYTPPTPHVNYKVVRNGVLTSGFVAKILGGSGAHNGMLWSRMTPASINSWGVTGWSYNDCLPFYKKSENTTGSRVASNTAYHGTSGPIQLSDLPTTQFYSAVDPWVQACVNSGLPYNPDFNGPTRVGCGTQQYNIRRGVRDSAAQAYLPKALAGGKLSLALGAQANKILFEQRQDGIYAVGVEYEQEGKKKRAYARREIVVSLSAILTPKLLQLSGIGPAALLRRFNIPVIVDNFYVGRNLSNNQFIGGAWAFPNATLPNGWRISDYTQEYALYGTGPLGFPGVFGTAYACSKPGCNDPDVLVASSAGIYFPGSNVPVLSLSVTASAPKSIGTVTIASADPNDPPIIDMPFYQNEADVNSTIFGFQLFRKIMKTYPANVTFGGEITPGPGYQTDDLLRQYILQKGIANAHYSGTGRIGNYNDPYAVVDPRLRVNGVKGLRIGDTSICHNSNSHSQASAVMVGERVAQFLLDDAAAQN